jgi:trans-aconitate methyltransferase
MTSPQPAVTLASLEEIAQRYHIAADMPDMFIEHQCQEHCCDWLAANLSPHDHVLELGVGDGITLRRLSPLPAAYVVLEGARSLAEQAAQRHPGVEVVHQLFEDYEPARPFTKVLALHVLEHVDDPVALLGRMRGWLAPEGELLVVVPNAESIHRRLAVTMGLQPVLDTLSPRDLAVGHQRVYSLDTLRVDLAAGGYEVLEERGFFLKVVPNGMMLQWPPALIDALNSVGADLPPAMLANLAVRARPLAGKAPETAA